MVAAITGDWYWLVLVVVVLFGGSQLPKLARNAGEAMKEFRKAHNEAVGQSGAATSTPSPMPAPTLPAGPVPPPTLAGGSMPSTPLPAASETAVVPPTGDERVTLTRSELDALLAHREAQARAANTPPSGS